MATQLITAGAYGNEVTNLQNQLVALGFAIPATETGRAFFGAATAQAVREFQQQSNLPVTGNVDAATASVLSNRVAALNISIASSSANPSITTPALQPSVAAQAASNALKSGAPKASQQPSQENAATASTLVAAGQPPTDSQVTANQTPTAGAGENLQTSVAAPVQAQTQAIGIDSNAKLKSLLATSPLLNANAKVQADFVSLYANFKGSQQNFWNSLAANPEFTPALITELKFNLKLNSLLSNNTALIALLRQQYPLTQFQDLTKITVDEWESLLNTPVNGQAITIPASITGDNQNQKVTNYAAWIAARITAQSPTYSIGLALKNQPSINMDNLQNVWSANPNLDPAEPFPLNAILPDNIDLSSATRLWLLQQMEYFAFPGIDSSEWRSMIFGMEGVFYNPVREIASNILLELAQLGFNLSDGLNGSTMVGGVNVFDLINKSNKTSPVYYQAVFFQILSLQRLSRLTINYNYMYVLQSNNLHSASAVAQIPQAAFLNQYSSQLGGRLNAQQIYANAINIHTQWTNVRLRVNEALNGAHPGIFGGHSRSDPANAANFCRSTSHPQKFLPLHLLDATQSSVLPNWSTLFGSQDTVNAPNAARSTARPLIWWICWNF